MMRVPAEIMDGIRAENRAAVVAAARRARWALVTRTIDTYGDAADDVGRLQLGRPMISRTLRHSKELATAPRV